MLTQILRKRTRVERAAWQSVRDLMPRHSKSRGIQYDLLEYLFEHLYERVSEQDLLDHLLKVKGHLQRTGDPVKQAINQAIKEIQRVPEQPFEIIKIQETTPKGKHRLVQMNYTRFEEVIGFDIYVDYLQDLLAKEEKIAVRGITPGYISPQLFPGLDYKQLGNCKAHFLVTPESIIPNCKTIDFRFIPRSLANIQLLLIYENPFKHQPFIGFIAHSYIDQSQDLEFIVYRGREKESKLRFLDRIWYDLADRALDKNQMPVLQEQARALASHMKKTETDWSDVILEGLVARKCEQDPSS